MKTIIAGPRDFFWYGTLLRAIAEVPWTITEVIYGGANGVDSMAKRWAAENGIPFKLFAADWVKYGKAAGPIRNKVMAQNGECLLALQYDEDIVKAGKRGQGTKNMIETASAAGLRMHIHRIETP